MPTGSNASAAFRQAIEQMDLAAVVATLAPDITFSSPIVFKTYHGRDEVSLVLAGVMQVFQDFRYTAEYTAPDGHVLRFKTRVGERDLEGADFLTFDDSGLISEFTVMVRPYTAATALREAMAAALAAYTQSSTDQRS